MQFRQYAQRLRILSSFGLLTLILVSGVLAGLAYAQISSSKSALAPYSNSSVVVNFDPKKGQLPEGLVLANNSNSSKGIFVSWAPIGKVAKIDKNNLIVSEYGSWPTIPPNKGFMLGLSFDKKGMLYAAIASQTPELKSGVYRLPVGGAGKATLFASNKNMTFPNDLLFGPQGQLFVSDSASGSLFVVEPNGNVRTWVSDPLLKGDRNFCPPAQLPINIGANGIAFDKNGTSLFVLNTDRASIISVPIMKDGSAGKPGLFVGPDCKNLNGADGIAVDKNDNGSMIIAVNKLNKIVKVSMDKKMTILESGGVLDFPASVKIDNSNSSTAGQQQQQGQGQQHHRILYITNFGFLSSSKHLVPKVAVLKVRLGSNN
ncbi:MAG TPA: SMP-30/gluconolactonase/LRE family protein [Nitrososphaeraceae archaeon]|nr:SMP-30/gluconolactonase/LRE family protein [Nitrososphaeraceae archaeon]